MADALGIQAHFSSSTLPKAELWAVGNDAQCVVKSFYVVTGEATEGLILQIFSLFGVY